jgi:hypothetical protein
MKHVYPMRHPAALDAPPNGQTTPARDAIPEPSLPHEQDESSHSQARDTAAQESVGRQAYDNATDGTVDTDKGPVIDRVYNEEVAPRRGASLLRR